MFTLSAGTLAVAVVKAELELVITPLKLVSVDTWNVYESPVGAEAVQLPVKLVVVAVEKTKLVGAFVTRVTVLPKFVKLVEIPEWFTAFT